MAVSKALTAQVARRTADAHYAKLVSDHDKEYEKIQKEKLNKISALKKSGRWDELIAEIEGHVQRISAGGGRDLSELPYMAFYLKGKDGVLFDDMKRHFEGQGFVVKEYSGNGLQLQW